MDEFLPFLKPVSPGSRTVLVSRHGRTVGNEAGIHQGWGTYALSDTGLKDAEKARLWWDTWTIDHVICSPLPRATQTADVLFGKVDEIDSAWVEQAVPGLAGLTIEQAHDLRPDLCRFDGWARHDAPLDRAQEHLSSVVSRTISALRKASGMVEAGGVVAVVAHGAVVASVAREAGIEAHTISNLGVIECEVDPSRGWKVKALHNPLENREVSSKELEQAGKLF